MMAWPYTSHQRSRELESTSTSSMHVWAYLSKPNTSAPPMQQPTISGPCVHHMSPAWPAGSLGLRNQAGLQTLWLLGGTLFSSISLIIDASFHQMEMDAKLQRDELLDRITMTMVRAPRCARQMQPSPQAGYLPQRVPAGL